MNNLDELLSYKPTNRDKVVWFFHRLRFKLDPRKILHFVQRGRRGYSGLDTANLTDYILGWLPEALVELRLRGFSHPPHLTPEEWGSILCEITANLRVAREDYPLGTDAGYLANVTARQEAFQRAWKLLGENFFSLWD